jgi:hypothetical protein
MLATPPNENNRVRYKTLRQQVVLHVHGSSGDADRQDEKEKEIERFSDAIKYRLTLPLVRNMRAKTAKTILFFSLWLQGNLALFFCHSPNARNYFLLMFCYYWR